MPAVSFVSLAFSNIGRGRLSVGCKSRRVHVPQASSYPLAPACQEPWLSSRWASWVRLQLVVGIQPRTLSVARRGTEGC